jgi:hypothetical protein
LGLRETGRPDGETQVRLPDGAIYRFKMVKQFCNVARPVGATRKQLPNLLHQWFGPNAGQPSTAFDVRFYASRDGWWAAAPPSRPHQRPAPGPAPKYPGPRPTSASTPPPIRPPPKRTWRPPERELKAAAARGLWHRAGHWHDVALGPRRR